MKKTALVIFINLLISLVLTACGDGSSDGGDSDTINTLAAPEIADAAAQTYTESTPIATLRFNNSGGGSLTSCSANSLPAGLEVARSSDNSTCEITGTPISAQPANTFTITASNASGSDTATVNITVNNITQLELTINSTAQIITANGISVNSGMVTGDTISDAIVSVDDILRDMNPVTSITITNESNKILEINNISVSSTVNIVITQNDSSDLLLSGAIGNTDGSTTINSLGNIYTVGSPGAGTPHIASNQIDLSAVGNIGTATNILEIDSSQDATGYLNAQAGLDVFLRETNGDLNIGAVVAANAVLQINEGDLVDINDDQEADIQAANIDLDAAAGSIGSTVNEIEIFGAGTGQISNSLSAAPGVPGAGRLLATAVNDIFITEVNGELVVQEVDAGQGEVQLNVLDTILAGNNLSVLENGHVTAPTAVSLSIGDAFYLPANSQISSDTIITINASVESGGATVDIFGSIDAPTLDIVTGSGLDTIELGSSTGINPNGTTSLSTNESTDTVIVRSVAGTTNIDLGSGADDILVGSPSGSLETIQGRLNIEVGEMGNGGTGDVITVETTASSGLSGTIENATITGLGMTGEIAFTAPEGNIRSFLEIYLGSGDDVMRVKDAPSQFVVRIYGEEGNDQLLVGNDNNSLTDINGIVSFEGGAGSDDRLNVFADAIVSDNPIWDSQLSAISFTGFGMGQNALLSTHNYYGAGYNTNLGFSYPGAIYYAKRIRNNGENTILSEVEVVEVFLGSQNNLVKIDSAYAGPTNIYGNDGNDIFSISSTGTGLTPGSAFQVDNILGALNLYGGAGNNTVVVRDSGEDQPNSGTYDNDTITGLDMLGSITINTPLAIPIAVSVLLGVQDDTFTFSNLNPDHNVDITGNGGTNTITGCTAPNCTFTP